MPFCRPFPRSFIPASVYEFAPQTSGVYGISNAKEWLYIGESDDIQTALLERFRDTGSELLTRRPTGFVFEECCAGERQHRQDELVREYSPWCNQVWR